MFKKIIKSFQKESKKLVLPEELKIVTDGEFFRWKMEDYISDEEYSTKKEAIERGISFYDYFKRKDKKRSHNWVEVEI